jgi:hypothetical protein
MRLLPRMNASKVALLSCCASKATLLAQGDA